MLIDSKMHERRDYLRKLLVKFVWLKALKPSFPFLDFVSQLWRKKGKISPYNGKPGFEAK